MAVSEKYVIDTIKRYKRSASSGGTLHDRLHALDSLSDHSIGSLTNTYLIKSDGTKLVPATNTDAQIAGAVNASHTRLHTIDSASDHTGISGTENNFFALNATGLFKDSGYNASSFSLSGHGHAHSSLSGLDYASAGHTGFEPTVTKGNLTAGSTKISIGGTGTGAVIGAGVSVDVAPGNINHNDLGSKQGGTAGEYYHLTSAQISALHTRSHALDSTSDHTIGSLTNTYLVKSDGTKLVPATNTDAQISDAVSASHARSHALDGTSDHTSGITQNYLIKANGSGLPAISQIFDNGTGVAIGTTGIQGKLNIRAEEAGGGGNQEFVNCFQAGDLSARLVIKNLNGIDSTLRLGIKGIQNTGSSNPITLQALSTSDSAGDNALVVIEGRNADTAGFVVNRRILTIKNYSTENLLTVNANGNVGIGTASPTAILHIKAGTAAAGTAPLKFTEGINLTTAEAGAMEWDGTNLFITQTAGNNRKTLPYTTDLHDRQHALDSTSDHGIGNLTANYILKNDGSKLVNSQIFDNGTYVGIGTSSPSEKLHIANTSGNVELRMQNISNSVYIRSYTDRFNIYVSGGGGEALTILQDTGNVGIGTASPGAKLQVDGLKLWEENDYENIAAIANKGITVSAMGASITLDDYLTLSVDDAEFVLYDDGTMSIKSAGLEINNVAGNGGIVLGQKVNLAHDSIEMSSDVQYDMASGSGKSMLFVTPNSSGYGHIITTVNAAIGDILTVYNTSAGYLFYFKGNASINYQLVITCARTFVCYDSGNQYWVATNNTAGP